jgi:hypothetical protein
MAWGVCKIWVVRLGKYLMPNMMRKIPGTAKRWSRTVLVWVGLTGCIVTLIRQRTVPADRLNREQITK